MLKTTLAKIQGPRLLQLFVVVLGINIFLQFEAAETLFNFLFSKESVVAASHSEICGTQAQISPLQQTPRGCILASSVVVGSSATSGKISTVGFLVSPPVLLVSTTAPTFALEPSVHTVLYLRDHSGLSPPIA